MQETLLLFLIFLFLTGFHVPQSGLGLLPRAWLVLGKHYQLSYFPVLEVASSNLHTQLLSLVTSS